MIKSLEYFRAIAIVLIVAGHFFYIANIESVSLLELTIQNLIFGGTTLFVFISGFLFHHVFYTRFKYKEFVTKKVKVIVLPYLVFSMIPAIYYSLKNITPDLYFDISVLNYAYLVAKYLITGTALQIYWYIPFIMLTFLLSPLHIRFIKLSTKTKLALIISLIITASFLHRSIDNYNLFHNFLYFTPIYLIGITSSIHKNKIYLLFKGKEYLLFAIVVIFAFLQAYIGKVGSYHKLVFEYNGVDLMLLQKLALSIFFMVWLHRYEDTKIRLLEIIAATSFTIYFMHAFLLWIITSLGLKLNNSWMAYVFLVSIVILFCSMAALAIKKVFKKHSRYIIGF